MSIIDQYFKHEPTGFTREDAFSRPALTSLECKKTGNYRPAEYAAQDEYILRGVIEIPFFANRAQLENARNVAGRVLLQRVYGPMLGCMSELRHAIHNSDAHEALRIIDRMQTEMGL